MADNSTTQKSKARNIDALMSNKNLNNVINTGLNSPLNSANRNKAASSIKSLDTAAGISPQVGIEGVQPEKGIGEASTNITPPLQAYSNIQGEQQDVGIGSASIGVQDTTQQKEKVSPYDVYNIESPEAYSGFYGQEKEKQKEQQQEGKVEIFPSVAGQQTTPSSRTKRVLQQQGMDTSGLADDITKKEYYKQWYNNLSDKEKKKFKPLYESVKKGVGASTFADQILRSKEKLKQMMPNVPEEALPAGASVVQQIDDLKNTLKQEYNIDELEQGVQQLQERGMTVQDDLESYMTARDEQISKVDSLIDKAKNRMTEMSNLADPKVAKRISHYMNYLYILKGRQQKRYADFLDSGVNYYNQKLKRRKNEYNNALSNFKSEFKQRKALTKEEHKRYKSLLKDMYNNIEEQAKIRSNKLEDQLKEYKNRSQLLSDTIEANETINTLESGGGVKNNFWESATDTQRNDAYGLFARRYKRNHINANSGDALKAWNNLQNYEKAEYIGYSPNATDSVLNRMPGMNSEGNSQENSQTQEGASTSVGGENLDWMNM